MKKTFFIIIVMLALTGCSASKETMSENSIAMDYLSQCNVKNSHIDTVKYEEISSYKNTPPTRNLTYISKNIDEVLESFYSIELSEDDIINQGDFLIFELELLKKDETSVFTDERAKLMIGTGLFDESVEKELTGKPVNETYVFNAGDKVKEFYNISDVEKLIIKPKEIYQYNILGSDTQTFLNENNFSGLKDLYIYLFNVKVDEHDFEKNTAIKNEFISYAIEKCTFTISYDDLKNYSTKVFEEHMHSAESLGINIDDYYTNVLSLNEDEFFRMCADTAEYEIKKSLLTGALSQHFSINVSNDYIEKFCEAGKIDYSDSVLKAYADYFCLESLVISEFVDLI
ncbi:MAG: hypothetical protein J1D89_05655 [Agathobacter sp.]|nr:hypothetical protein [Agathobacter sp.]